ncbi:hypothetical protein E4U44_004001 [Claviceps purpurea]|nr:hypothetical protein E4U44_004001 [Claviceps purpurea]
MVCESQRPKILLETCISARPRSANDSLQSMQKRTPVRHPAESSRVKGSTSFVVEKKALKVPQKHSPSESSRYSARTQSNKDLPTMNASSTSLKPRERRHPVYSKQVTTVDPSTKRRRRGSSEDLEEHSADPPYKNESLKIAFKETETFLATI